MLNWLESSEVVTFLQILYAEVDNAVHEEDYNDASLLQSQADLLSEVVENLETLLSEQEE